MASRFEHKQRLQQLEEYRRYILLPALDEAKQEVKRAKDFEQAVFEGALRGFGDGTVLYEDSVAYKERVATELQQKLDLNEKQIALAKYEIELDGLEDKVEQERKKLAGLKADRFRCPGIDLEARIAVQQKKVGALEEELTKKRPYSAVVNPVAWLESKREAWR